MHVVSVGMGSSVWFVGGLVWSGFSNGLGQ